MLNDVNFHDNICKDVWNLSFATIDRLQVHDNIFLNSCMAISYSYGLSVNNNMFLGTSTGNGSSISIWVKGDSNKGQIFGNQMYGLTDTGIQFSQTAKNVQIMDNHIESTKNCCYLQGDDNSNVTIMNNYFNSSTLAALKFTPTAATGLVITNNTLIGYANSLYLAVCNPSTWIVAYNKLVGSVVGVTSLPYSGTVSMTGGSGAKAITFPDH